MNAATEFLYGINPAFEVLRAGRRPVHKLWIQSGSGNPRLKKLAAFCERMDFDVLECDKHQLYNRCGTREHQGVVMEAGPFPYADPDQALTADRLLLIDNVEDPHNLGAILRSADVFGFHHVLLPNRGSPEVYPSVVKASAGACEHLSICRAHGAVKYVQRAVEAGFQIIALDPAGDTPLSGLILQSRYVLVVGGEDKGIGRYILNAADARVSIASQGRVNSLNASVAAAVAMHSLIASCE